MASTRNNNMRTEYSLQQRQYGHVFDRNTYEHSSNGNPVNPGLPLAGSAPPSHMSRCDLSSNSIDIETQLFGISSTNLVKRPEKVNPRLKKLKDIKFFDRKEVLLPRDIFMPTNQHALPIL